MVLVNLVVLPKMDVCTNKGTPTENYYFSLHVWLQLYMILSDSWLRVLSSQAMYQFRPILWRRMHNFLIF